MRLAALAGMLGLVVAGPVMLRDSPAVYPGVQAMPVVTGGVSPEVADKVNAAFRRVDAKVGAAAADCRKSFAAQHHKSAKDAWKRRVEVTMGGPRYLSVVATDSYFCGGMYPNDGLLLPLVYDLNTGGTVNWLKLLPAGATSGIDEAGDGSKVGEVIWPALTALAKEKADQNCRDAFEGQVSFVLWLDAKAGAVEAQPFSFPHAEAGCAKTLVIPVGQARKMGLDGGMLDALAAAYGLQR